MFKVGDPVYIHIEGKTYTGVIEDVGVVMKNVALVAISGVGAVAVHFDDLELIESNTNKQDLLGLMDFALDTEDKEWFYELLNRVNKMQ